jgi:hypothetical protein
MGINMSAFSQALNNNMSNQSVPAKEASPNEKLEKIRSALQRKDAIITGIGARDTPGTDLTLLTKIAAKAEERGMTGRSGGAGGAEPLHPRAVRQPHRFLTPWASD